MVLVVERVWRRAVYRRGRQQGHLLLLWEQLCRHPAQSNHQRRCFGLHMGRRCGQTRVFPQRRAASSRRWKRRADQEPKSPHEPLSGRVAPQQRAGHVQLWRTAVLVSDPRVPWPPAQPAHSCRERNSTKEAIYLLFIYLLFNSSLTCPRRPIPSFPHR